MNDNDDDLDWLYRRERPKPEATRVFRPDEVPEEAPMPQDIYRPGPRAQSGPTQPAPQQAVPGPQPPYQQPPNQQPPAQADPSSAGGGEPPRQGRTRGRRRHPVRNTLLVLLALWLVFMIGTPVFAWLTGTVVDASPAGERPPQQPGEAILLVGSDSREGLTPEQQKELGTGSTEGRRTDTMMLLYKPPSGRSALISLPRDSLVDIPGHNRNKLNAAFAFGGPQLLVETVELNTGIRVDGYLEVGFLGIVEVVNALGGIEVCLDAPIQDKDSHLDLPAGCQVLDGVNALGYVRMRKADPRGDVGRMERQREVIATIAKKVINPINFLNPVTYWRLNMAASHSLVRGEGFGLGDMWTTVTGFISAASGSGMSMMVPVSDANAHADVGSVMIWDEQASAEMFDAIKAGDTAALEKFEQ